MQSAIGNAAGERASNGSWRFQSVKRSLALVGLLLVLLLAGAGYAEAQLPALPGQSTAPAAAKEPAPEAAVRDVSEALARVLADPAARDLFLEQLRRADAPAGTATEPAADAAPASLFPPGLTADVDALTASVVGSVTDIVQRTWSGLLNLRAFFDGSIAVDWSELLARSEAAGAMILAAIIVTTLLRALAQLPLGKLDRRAAGRPRWQRFLLGAAAALIDFVPSIVGFLAMIGVGAWVSETGRLGFVEAQLLAAYAAAEAARQVVRILFRPQHANLRLVDCPDSFAGYWSTRIGALVSFVSYGLVFVGPAVSHLVGFRLGIGLRMAIVVAATVTAIILILRNQHSVRRQLVEASNTAESPAIARMLVRLSGIWHILLIAYLLTGFVVWSTRPADALLFMLSATLWSIVALAVGALVLRFTRRADGGRVHLPDSLKASLPMLERRVNLFVPTMTAAIRIVAICIVFLAILDAWTLIDISGWLRDVDNASLIRRIAAAAVVLLLMIAGWLAATSWIEYQLNPSRGRAMRARTRTLFSLLSNAITVVFAAIGLMLVLSELGVNIAPLIAGAGVVGLAVGFGAQKLVQDIITGAFIQLENAMNEGEVVTAGGISGVVERLTIRSVGLRDLSGVYHVIPFSSVDSVSNFMRGFAFHVEELSVAYREDISEVKQVMFDAFDRLKETPHAAHILEPLDMQGVIGLGDNGVTIRVRIKTSAGQQWAVGRAYTEALKTALDERGIDIPFPQRTLWFGQPKSGEAPPLTFTGRVRPAPGAAPRREEHGGEDQVAAVRTPAETLDVPRSPEHEHG